jgi:hypothetical protein
MLLFFAFKNGDTKKAKGRGASWHMKRASERLLN